MANTDIRRNRNWRCGVRAWETTSMSESHVRLGSFASVLSRFVLFSFFVFISGQSIIPTSSPHSTWKKKINKKSQNATCWLQCTRVKINGLWKYLIVNQSSNLKRGHKLPQEALLSMSLNFKYLFFFSFDNFTKWVYSWRKLWTGFQPNAGVGRSQQSMIESVA